MTESPELLDNLLLRAAKEQTHIAIHADVKAIEVSLDIGQPYYTEWIQGEGADICLYRSQETNRVVGCFLPLKHETLVIHHVG